MLLLLLLLLLLHGLMHALMWNRWLQMLHGRLGREWRVCGGRMHCAKRWKNIAPLLAECTPHLFGIVRRSGGAVLCNALHTRTSSRRSLIDAGGPGCEVHPLHP